MVYDINLYIINFYIVFIYIIIYERKFFKPMIYIIKKIDKILLLCIITLAVLSVLMIASITGEPGDRINSSVIVQMAAFFLGFIFIFLIVNIDCLALEKFELHLYILAILLQLSVYIPVVGMEIQGSRAWLNLGITTVQPSEFTKILFILCLSSYLKRNMTTLFTFKGFVKSFIYAAPIIAIVMKEDFGAAIVLSFMYIGMVFTAGLRAGLFLRMSIIFAVCIPIFYRFMKPHQRARFDAFLHPDNLSITATYQVYQSKIAIGSGGLFGTGLFNGIIKESNFLPVQESDFIFAIICEELGFVGGLGLILVYGLLGTRIWKVISSSKDYFSAFVATGGLCLFGFQIFENIGMVMGIMPVTGITLPFMSQGGTSVLANMIMLGLILSIGIRNKGLK
jgi:rod shape determining protein RodA